MSLRGLPVVVGRTTVRWTSYAVLLGWGLLGSEAYCQVGGGYIGVFGDGAGAVRCMQAPPYTPTTLYVLAKAAGATSGGIAGAEFRIGISNPTGYLMNYAAPAGLLVLGDPLGVTGATLAFSACREPINGIVSLGTIQVFNTGSGGQSDILVTRRSPPSNENYPCALLVKCDSPEYTKRCTTVPPDSISCLTTQKARSESQVNDAGFVSYLGGNEVQEAARQYVGCQFFSCTTGFVFVEGKIDGRTWNPSNLPEGVAVWVGIQDCPNLIPPIGYIQQHFWRWAQAGYTQLRTDTNSLTYFEYWDKNIDLNNILLSALQRFDIVRL